MTEIFTMAYNMAALRGGWNLAAPYMTAPELGQILQKMREYGSVIDSAQFEDFAAAIYKYDTLLASGDTEGAYAFKRGFIQNDLAAEKLFTKIRNKIHRYGSKRPKRTPMTKAEREKRRTAMLQLAANNRSYLANPTTPWIGSNPYTSHNYKYLFRPTKSMIQTWIPSRPAKKGKLPSSNVSLSQNSSSFESPDAQEWLKFKKEQRIGQRLSQTASRRNELTKKLMGTRVIEFDPFRKKQLAKAAERRQLLEERTRMEPEIITAGPDSHIAETKIEDGMRISYVDGLPVSVDEWQVPLPDDQLGLKREDMAPSSWNSYVKAAELSLLHPGD